jgi:predicted dehydrogenase
MAKVRIATIGTSMITGLFLQAVEQVDGIEFVGAYSRSADKAEQYAKEHGGTAWWDDLDALYASDDIDAVYIASPNLLHLPQALGALAHGKHVMVEKPMGVNTDEARRIVDAARAAGVVAMEALRPNHDPAYAAIKANLPKLGRIRKATLRYEKYSSRYDLVLKGEHTNIFDPNFATGALMDLGVYPVNSMVYLFGAPDDVRAFADTIEVGQDGLIDVAGSALCDYDGMVAEIAYSKVTMGLQENQIQGEQATMTFDSVTSPENIAIRWRDGREETIAVDAPHLSNTLSPEVTNMAFEVDDFVAMCLGELDAEPFNAIAIQAREVMDAIRFATGVVFPPDGQEID